MAGFLDDLSGLLGGGGGGGNARSANGMTDFGALSDPASSVKNVLATLRSAGSGAAAPQPQMQGGMPGAMPAGASAAPGGGMPAPSAGLNPMVSGFAAGMAAQRPGQSGGGAFLSGLAGALGGRQNAEIQNQKLGIEQAQWKLEAQKQQLAINAAQKQAEAMDKFAKDNGGGSGGYPAWYGGAGAQPQGGGMPPGMPPAPSPPQGGGGQPMPTPPAAPPQGAPPAPPLASGDPATPGVGPSAAPAGGPAPGPMPLQGGAPPPSAPPQGGSPPGPQGVPAGPAPAPQAPQGGSPAPQAPPPQMVPPQMSATPQFWQRVGPEQNPEFLRARAARNANIIQSNPYLPDKMQDNLRAQAQQDISTAQQIMTSGQVMVGGRPYMIPGIAENDATKKAMETTAVEHAKNVENFNNQEQVTDSGSKFKPNPNGPQAGAQQLPGNSGQLPAAPPPQSAPAAPPARETSSVDPDTAQVQTAIPKAPVGGGFTHDPSIPAGAAQLGQSPLNKSRSETDGKITEDMAVSAPQIETAIERANAVSQAFKLFTSGAGAEKVQNAALLAEYANAPDWVKKGITSGNPDAMQWVQKEGVPTAFSIVRAGLPPGSRAAQQEFRVSEQKATPNAGSSPQANHENVSEMMGELNYKRQFAQDWAQAQQQGWQSVSAFQTQWAKANKPADFVRAAQRQIGNYAGMPTPSPTDMASGSVYVYDPKGMPAKAQAWYANEGIKPGGLFRWNGNKAQQAITPLDTSNGQGFNIR